MYSIEQLKGIDAAVVAGCSAKHIQSVIEELIATALALAEDNHTKDLLLLKEAVPAREWGQQCDELLKDAKRYWWLRDNAASHKVPARNGTEIDGFGLKVAFQNFGSDFRCQPIYVLFGETLDAAVDEAIAVTPRVKGGSL